jgi:glycosyltransferase involved in cell wall biosynthesis
MSILFGHPVGNPNAHNAALAYAEAGLLECFCIPWMPSEKTTDALNKLRVLRPFVDRLRRRQFAPLAEIPKVQGRLTEILRLVLKGTGIASDGGEMNNRWLMRTMSRECGRNAVTAVHSYEDCSHWQFMEAKRLGKACVYDMPTCYYPAWQSVQTQLAKNYPDWISSSFRPDLDAQRVERKAQEMSLADLTLVPSNYVDATIRDYFPYKNIAQASYGVDVEFWAPAINRRLVGDPIQFIYAGNISLRKGIPLLLEAWDKAALKHAELTLVGHWQLAGSKLRELPAGVRWVPACSSNDLRERYRTSDVFLFPSYSEGFGLVLLEAMACGLPAIASETSIGPEVITSDCGFVVPAGNLDALVEHLAWFVQNRAKIARMGLQARKEAERWTWGNYRARVNRAVSGLL